MDENYELLEETIKKLIEKLDDLDPSSKEAASVCSNIEKLYKLKIEATRAENDYQTSSYKISVEEEKAKMEDVRQKDEANRKTKEFWIGILKKGAELASICAFFAWQNKIGYFFEENGCYKSSTFRDSRRVMTPKIKMDV